jgi:hypothetical protein
VAEQQIEFLFFRATSATGIFRRRFSFNREIISATGKPPHA